MFITMYGSNPEFTEDFPLCPGVVYYNKDSMGRIVEYEILEFKKFASITPSVFLRVDIV